MSNNKTLSQNLILLSIISFGILIWTFPVPEGLSDQAWHLLIIFCCTIIGIVLNPLPIGAVTSLSMIICILTKTLTLEECLGGFADEIVWLIILAFFISHGFIKTGLGNRIAYGLILLLGRSTLGLAYSLVFSDLVLAPMIPSVTARGGGILFPIANALSKTFGSDNNHTTLSRNGGFLMKVCFQSNVITSAMFLTAMAANPVAVKLAGLFNITITWGGWALAACLPGLACLVIMPLIIYYYLYPPTIKHSEEAPLLARKHLKEMGPFSFKEICMSLVFLLLIFLWMFGKELFGINATTAALVGFCLLLLLRLVNFEEIAGDKNTWHTFMWFAFLLAMSGFLSKLGIPLWIGNQLKSIFINFSPLYSLILLSLVYFYIHYIFASTTAHVTVLFPTFLLLFLESGIPKELAALILIFLSIFSSGLTHFGLSSAPIFFATGHMKAKTWYFIGLTMSIVYLAIWITIAPFWWKVIGLW